MTSRPRHIAGGEWEGGGVKIQRKTVGDNQRAHNLKFTGLTQNLDQLSGFYRDSQSNCWVNSRILGQPCEFYLHARSIEVNKKQADA
jgi:hypothetical protein